MFCFAELKNRASLKFSLVFIIALFLKPKILFLIWAVLQAAECACNRVKSREAKGQCNCQPQSEGRDKWKTKNSFAHFQEGTFHLMRPSLALRHASAGDFSHPCFASSDFDVLPNPNAPWEHSSGGCRGRCMDPERRHQHQCLCLVWFFVSCLGLSFPF